MKRNFVLVFVLSLVALSSCRNGADEARGDIVTRKILYDVPIVNLKLDDRTENGSDWYWENLPYPSGDEFIDNLFAEARDCDIPIYYYDPDDNYDHLERIPDKEVKQMFENDMKVTLPVPDIYDEESGDYITRPSVEFTLDQTRILKLRFLEEWRIYDGMIEKKVLAVAPMFTINIGGTETQDGYSYNTVKFWFMADPKLLK